MPTINQLIRVGREKLNAQDRGSGADEVTPTPGGLYPGLYLDPQEAQLGLEKSGPGSLDQWL